MKCRVGQPKSAEGRKGRLPVQCRNEGRASSRLCSGTSPLNLLSCLDLTGPGKLLGCLGRRACRLRLKAIPMAPE